MNSSRDVSRFVSLSENTIKKLVWILFLVYANEDLMTLFEGGNLKPVWILGFPSINKKEWFLFQNPLIFQARKVLQNII